MYKGTTRKQMQAIKLSGSRQMTPEQRRVLSGVQKELKRAAQLFENYAMANTRPLSQRQVELLGKKLVKGSKLVLDMSHELERLGMVREAQALNKLRLLIYVPAQSMALYGADIRTIIKHQRKAKVVANALNVISSNLL